MDRSLLAHLLPYFKGSQEDVATCALNYIVCSNSHMLNAYNNLISDLFECDPLNVAQYKCQAIGENNERPDMAGYDVNGDELILCESKFYAALTINQPNTYLDRLISQKGIGLVFVCPVNRLNGLWNEIINIASSQYNLNKINPQCVEINGVRMGILSWNEVLTKLENVSESVSPESLADIKQLRGYCSQLESETFAPFVEEELSIESALRIEKHYKVLDEIVDSLRNVADIKLSLKGLKATPQWSGYTRYVRINNLVVAIMFTTQKWKNPENLSTPYWIKIAREDWEIDAACKRAILKIEPRLVSDDGLCLALIAPPYLSLSEVANEITKQIKEYIKIFESETE